MYPNPNPNPNPNSNPNPNPDAAGTHNGTQGGWAGYNPELQQGLYPTETATDFAYIPFGGGIRKCVGDQFAVMESTVVLSMLLQRFSFQLACAPEAVGMVTGATIHTKGGLPMRILKRK